MNCVHTLQHRQTQQISNFAPILCGEAFPPLHPWTSPIRSSNCPTTKTSWHKKIQGKKQQTKGCLSGRANHKVWACIGSGAWSRPQLAPYPPPPTSLKWGIAATDAVEQTTLCGCSGTHTSWSDNCAGKQPTSHRLAASRPKRRWRLCGTVGGETQTWEGVRAATQRR